MNAVVTTWQRRLLRVWLVLMIIANTYGILRLYDLVTKALRGGNVRFVTGMFEWAIPFLVLMSIVAIIALVIIWFSRRIGFYVLVLGTVGAGIVNLMLNVPPLNAFTGLFGIVVLWILLGPQWDHMK